MKTAALAGAALFPATTAWSQGHGHPHGAGKLNEGDAAILRLLAAAELIESDLWQQYNELGGIQDSEVPGGSGSPAYVNALLQLDMDMPQYIHDNTEDEISHAAFINAYLVSRGADPVNLDAFRVLPSSQATGAQDGVVINGQHFGRLTNLMQLTVDTSWWTRYRSRDRNPDLDPNFRFPPAVPSLLSGQFPAIPRSDADLAPDHHIQAIANTAGFHFGFIEQGGSSIYPSLALKVTDLEVLRILLSIGPTETSHFQTWHDKAGNAPAITDPTNPNLVFPNLNAPPFPPHFGLEDFQTNLIMPEPCPFLRHDLPRVSIIRPTGGGRPATAAINGFVQDGLFIGQSEDFLELLFQLADEADEAMRGDNG